MVQNLGLDQQAQSGYVNPFANFGPVQGGAISVKPPLMGEFAEFDNDIEESSTDWAEVYRAHQKRKKQIDIMEERSEGELGPLDDDSEESIGEVVPGGSVAKNIMGRPIESAPRSRYGPTTGTAEKAGGGARSSAASKPQMSMKKSEQVKSNYEGGKEGTYTQSFDDYDEFEDSSQLPPAASSGLKRSRDLDIARGPIQDSNEDPIPKQKKRGANGANGKAQVLMSGESFGGKNPLVASSGGVSAVKNAKNTTGNKARIEEDFLENFDDYSEGEL